MAPFTGRLATPQTACLSSQRKLTTTAAILIISEVLCEHKESVQAQREPGNPQPAFVAQMRTHKPHWWHQAGRQAERKEATERQNNEAQVQYTAWQVKK